MTSALKIKKEHLDLYSKSCIKDWTDIAIESDMEQVNFQMGRVGAFMQRFCASRDNMEFCGQLLFQYVMLASLRNSVRLATFTVVHRSTFDNQPFKYGGLVSEYKKTLEFDKSILAPVTTNPRVKSPYCHIACAIRGKANDAVTKYDAKNYTNTRLALDKPRIKLINTYLTQVSIFFINTE